MMEAVHTSETSFYFNKTTWCYIADGSHLLHFTVLENLVVANAVKNYLFYGIQSFITVFKKFIYATGPLQLLETHKVPLWRDVSSSLNTHAVTPPIVCCP
jgi:hypothetical protein